jgi:hypothetical protein
MNRWYFAKDISAHVRQQLFEVMGVKWEFTGGHIRAKL